MHSDLMFSSCMEFDAQQTAGLARLQYFILRGGFLSFASLSRGINSAIRSLDQTRVKFTRSPFGFTFHDREILARHSVMIKLRLERVVTLIILREDEQSRRIPVE